MAPSSGPLSRAFPLFALRKKFTAQVNEVLCKVLVFNLGMLVNAMYELGIEAKLTEVR